MGVPHLRQSMAEITSEPADIQVAPFIWAVQPGELGTLHTARVVCHGGVRVHRHPDATAVVVAPARDENGRGLSWDVGATRCCGFLRVSEF